MSVLLIFFADKSRSALLYVCATISQTGHEVLF